LLNALYCRGATPFKASKKLVWTHASVTKKPAGWSLNFIATPIATNVITDLETLIAMTLPAPKVLCMRQKQKALGRKIAIHAANAATTCKLSGVA